MKREQLEPLFLSLFRICRIMNIMRSYAAGIFHSFGIKTGRLGIEIHPACCCSLTSTEFNNRSRTFTSLHDSTVMDITTFLKAIICPCDVSLAELSIFEDTPYRFIDFRKNTQFNILPSVSKSKCNINSAERFWDSRQRRTVSTKKNKNLPLRMMGQQVAFESERQFFSLSGPLPAIHPWQRPLAGSGPVPPPAALSGKFFLRKSSKIQKW